MYRESEIVNRNREIGLNKHIWKGIVSGLVLVTIQ